MEKERERADEKNYPDPIQPTKEATDNNYNAAVDFVLENLDRVAAFFGTHNEKSTELAIDKMKTRIVTGKRKRRYGNAIPKWTDGSK